MSKDSEEPDAFEGEWWKTTKPGTIMCSARSCGHKLHAFRLPRTPKGRSYRHGVCIGCGFDGVDWDRLDRRDIHDVDHTIQSLDLELIRFFYRRTPIEPEVITQAKELGLEELKTRTRFRLERVIGPPIARTFRGGFTPWVGNIIYYGQHGTATCCRRCLEEWHGIDRNTELSKRDLDYFTDLVLQFAQTRVPLVPM